jgi:hypothetical protein
MTSEAWAIVSAYHRHRFGWLFVTLLSTLAAGPMLDTLAPRYNPLQLLLAATLLAAIASVARERKMRVLLVLGLGFVVARLLRVTLGVPGMLRVGDALWLIVIVLATLTSLRHALGRGAVNAERILAALDVYLLAGLLFGVAYWTLEDIWPGSFGGATSGTFGLSRAIYFSFVTIATLGYGDVIPVSEAAQGLAIVEAVFGQLYLAVLVARLVSLYSQQSD